MNPASTKPVAVASSRWMEGNTDNTALTLCAFNFRRCNKNIPHATAPIPNAPYASKIVAACKLVSQFEKSGFGPCGGSSDGINANTPTANNTGEANAPRNFSRGSNPITRQANASAQSRNRIAS